MTFAATYVDYATLKHSMAESSTRSSFSSGREPLVGGEYRDPLGTYATNVMGTAHMLEAAAGNGQRALR